MAAGNLTDNVMLNLGPKVGAQVHPIYQLLKPTWVQLAHVREGTGGFLSTANDSYIVPHPREWLDHTIVQTDKDTGATVTRVNPNPKNPSPKLQARRLLARYENLAASLLESKKSLLFREQPTRRVGAVKKDANAEPTELEQWWENVDGDGQHINDAMVQWWDLAGSLGHVVLYMDVGGDQDIGPGQVQTAADQSSPFVRVYTPLDVLDWRRDENGTLVWIKLLEAVQGPTTLESRGVTTFRVRVVDEVSWKLYDYKSGKYLSQGDHGFGCLPVAYLFGKRRSLLADIGDSVLGDPRNHIDLFNLTSELRELLRNQTFSFINLPLGTGPDAMSVEAAQAMMGQQTGTMNVLFSASAAQILSADAANVAAYQAEIQRVKREIYREAGVPYESDTKDAEAAQSLELKREELAVRVAQYADECEQTEYKLVDLWYRATYGADQGPVKMEADEVQIHYPEHFKQTPFKDVLDEAAAAQNLGMPGSFMRELRKSMVSKFEGMSNLDPETLKTITNDIDAMTDDPTPADKMQQKLALAAAISKPVPKPDLAKPGAGNQAGAAAA
jgi:hypothetical protein